MRSIKLKVCGMKDKDNILDIASVHPDYMGFIFYKNSPRYVGDDFEIPRQLDATIKRVGVFVNEQSQTIMVLASKHRLDLVQLHGEETPAQCQQLKEKGIGVVKVLSIGDGFDFSLLKPYEPFVDYFLFDTLGKLRGGNGIPFNWNILEQYRSQTPFFLSGGIESVNVNEVMKLKYESLVALDVNSGVEEYPGFKSRSKIDELVSKIKTQIV